MKKLFTFLFVGLLFTTISFSQTTLFEEDFESFTSGDNVAQSDASGFWTTWSNSPGGSEDAVISTDQNNTVSGANSMLVSGSNDMILKLGNKQSGAYEINFYYYIEAGFGGYFNFQHFEAPGNEWAVEVYFGNTGTGRVVQNGDHTFSYNQDEWVLITTTVDLDNDVATMTIGGNLIHTWTFSQQADGTAGTKKLGGINFYAGAESGQTSKYYADDIEYIQTVAGSDPAEVDVSIANITTDGSADETFDITNNGDLDLDFYLYATYPESSKKSYNNEPIQVTLSNNGTKDRDGTLTHVQSDFGGGVGYTNPTTVKAAAYFSADAVKDYIGMELTNVIIGINNVPGASSTAMMVWEKGSTTTPGPGTLLEEVDFTPSGESSQNLVSLSTPLYIDGSPIWFGYICDDLGTDNYPIGIDQGARVPGVNWLSTGPGWGEMNAATDANIFVVGNLVGAAVTQWLSVSPESGTLTSGNSETITASFDLTGLTNGTYNANIVVASNDQANEYVELPVTLDVANSIDNINSGIMTFPNPVTDIFTIVSDNNINNVQIMSLEGKLIRNVTPNSNSYKFDLSNLSTGVYIFEIKTQNQTITRKVVVE